MDTNQKEFLVTRIEKYSEVLDEQTKSQRKVLFILGLNAIFAISFLLQYGTGMWDFNEILKYLYLYLSIGNMASFIVLLRWLMLMIAHKAGISHRINKIEEIIKYLEKSNEKKDMSK